MHRNKISYIFFIVISNIFYQPKAIRAQDDNELKQTQQNPSIPLEKERDDDEKKDLKHLIYVDTYSYVNGQGYKNINNENSTEDLRDVKQISDDDSIPTINKTSKEYDPDALCMNFYRESPQSNQVCSSLSALIPIGKLTLGAKGQTLTELLTLFNSSGKPLVKAKFIWLIQKLIAVKHNVLDLASNVFVDIVLPIKKEFMEVTQSVFHSTVLHIDMVENASNAAKIINDWVKNSTYGEIKELITPSDIQNSLMVIVNALYFKGTWTIPFNNTVKELFYTPLSVRKCDMMKNENVFMYAESKSLDSQILKLPFRYDELSLYIVLPKKRYGLRELLITLKKYPNLLDEAKKLLSLANVNVSLPKFSTASTIHMNKLVQDEGVTQMFQSEADFSEMTSRKIHVGQIVQKTVMHIDEKGASFAGATGYLIEPESEIDIPEGVKTFHADHPFLYFLEIDNVVLLSGILNSPSSVASRRT